MDPKITSSVLLLCLAVQVNCEPHLSEQVLLALPATKETPKCFTRNLEDFTCFWEGPAGKSYGFFYKTDDPKRCNLHQQDSGTKILHVCYFLPSDVFLFTDTHLMLLDTDTNTTIYEHTVSVEDNVLPYCPFNVSLHLTGHVGQLLVSWKPPEQIAGYKVEYEIQYYTITINKTEKVISHTGLHHKLLSLVPAKNYTVQIRLKPIDSGFRGHWSDWSPPVAAVVPQPADDIKLECFTSDLYQVRCRWNEGQYDYNHYSLHYRQTNSSNSGGWGRWRICDRSDDPVIQCLLYGDEYTMFQVHLKAGLEPHNQTFYMKMFKMNSSIMTEPPQDLKEEVGGGRLCLRWSCPCPLICQHLKYQVHYHLYGEDGKFFSVLTNKTCLDAQLGNQYTIQVKAMPNGVFYSGHWSAWSEILVVRLPSHTGMLFIICVPIGFLIFSIMFLSFFSRSASKLKLFLWPPVPNLNDVLESFLKDINGQNWDPNFSIKLCDDDIAASVVEIMSEKEPQVVKKAAKGSNIFLTSQQDFLGGSIDEEHTDEGVLEVSREYVTLNTNNVLPCMVGNDYVYKMNATPGQDEENLCCCSSLCSTTSTSILNHSYLQAEVGGIQTSTNHYTNLENATFIKPE